MVQGDRREISGEGKDTDREPIRVPHINTSKLLFTPISGPPLISNRRYRTIISTFDQNRKKTQHDDEFERKHLFYTPHSLFISLRRESLRRVPAKGFKPKTHTIFDSNVLGGK